MDESVGRYEVVGRLADGAMGQVYLARRFPQGSAPKYLVLKRIRPELQTDPNIVLMFQDEARLASQMSHPHIVRLYEVGELDGSLFLAMELVEGVTVENLLATLVTQRRFIPIELGLTIALGILSALDYAHTFKAADGRPLNIVHRDVSPQNLMIGYGGEVKLLDFGVTRAEGRLHQTLPGLLKGKLAYMAPETIEGRRIDGRADLFSLGSVLYEMLLLKHPFFGSTDAMVLRSIVEEPPVHPEDLDPEFPPELATIMLDALAKDPDHRIESAAAFKARLEAFLVDSNLQTRAGPEPLGDFLRELYSERIEVHEEAKAADDDGLLLQALRGFVQKTSRRAMAVVEGSTPPVGAPDGPYALPHSHIDLNYARVPTADLPVIRRNPSALNRPSLEDVLFNAYEPEQRPRDARPLDNQLGRYRLLEIVEQSPLHHAYRARLMGPAGFSKNVLLKRLPPDQAQDPDRISPLTREAKIRANLNHPHVEALIDFEDNPETFLVLEPLDGWDLGSILDASARGHRAAPTASIALRIVLDIVEALEYLHTSKDPIVHRSVDPKAVLIYRIGVAKLTGFAAALTTHALEPNSGDYRRMSLDRLAPETVDPSRGPEGPHTDVYGAVLLLTECLTLNRPFLRDDADTVIQAIQAGIDNTVIDGLPSNVRMIVQRGLAVSSSDRFADMGELKSALVNTGPVADRAAVRRWFAGNL